MTQYRIDDLARETGTSVRNIRYYQDNGMIPPPRRVGRVAVYSDLHLARLKLILRLLERGYTASNIVELVGAWEKGRDLGDVLGLEQVLSEVGAPGSPTYLTGDELCAAFGSEHKEAGLLDKIVDAGLAARDGDRYRLPNLQMVSALGALARQGAPIAVVLDVARKLRQGFDDVIREIVKGVAEQILRDRTPDWIPETAEIPDLTAHIQQVQPLINTAVTSILNLTLEQHVADALGDYIARILPHLNTRTATP